MGILNPDKARKFRDKLYQKKVSKLLQHGGRGLKPLERYKKDEQGRIMVSARRITDFFLQEVLASDPPPPDRYIQDLYTILRIMSQGAEPVSFDCGFSIPQEEIEAGDPITAVERLTANIIITYFNTLKTHEGRVDKSLLTPDLKALIAKSCAGTNYNALITRTLATLANSLETDKPWPAYLDDLSHAGLVCRLTGESMPATDQISLDKITGKSRKEILVLNTTLTKILNARKNISAREENKKKYLAAMEKLNGATLTLLGQIDQYLASAHRLISILGLSTQAVLGKADPLLKQNLAGFFLASGQNGPGHAMDAPGLTSARYRLNILFQFPDIIRYCRAFQTISPYQRYYLDLFVRLFKDLTEKMTTGDGPLPKRYLEEICRAVEGLGLKESSLAEEKQAVQQAYTAMIRKTDFHDLAPLMAMGELVVRATQDRARELGAAVRSALVDACASGLDQYAKESPGPKAPLGIKKRLQAYALYYKPLREFYRSFFDAYMGSKSQPISPYLARIIKEDNAFAAALAKVFSDEAAMKDLLPARQIDHAAALLDQIPQGS